MHAGKLLRETPQVDFVRRLSDWGPSPRPGWSADPDTALLVLIVTATSELRQYSATHSMLVAVVCELAARHMPEIGPPAGACRCAVRR